MIRSNHTITRNDYAVIIVIVGAVVLVASLFSGNEFAFFIIAPLSVVLIGIGVVLTKRNDTGSKGLARHQRFILFGVAMLLLAFFAYFLIVIYRVVLT